MKTKLKTNDILLLICVFALIALTIGSFLVEGRSARYIPYHAEIVASETAKMEEIFSFPVMHLTNDEVDERIELICEERKSAGPRRLEVIEVEKPDISENDRYCLACVICQEVGGLDEYMKILVGNVVMNRVASPHFPDTIYGVITQKYQYGMMWKYGVHFPSWATQDIIDDCYAAADFLLSGKRICPSNVVYQAEFPQGSESYYYSDGVYFCCE